MTDLTGHAGERTPADAARIAVRLATLHDFGPFGGFFLNDDVIPVFSSSLSESFPALRSLWARSLEMKKTRHTEEQIALALKQAETNTSVAKVIRRMRISEQTIYRWKKVYGGLGVGELRRQQLLEEENRKLKQLVADLSLGKHILQDVLSEKP